MKNVYLIRHGSIEEKYTGKYVGSLDVKLSSKGEREAVAVGRFMKQFPIDKIFVSPMTRVKQTLQLAVGVEGEELECLREIDFGAWEGLTFAEIDSKWGNLVDLWWQGASDFAFPEGESLEHFYKRLDEFIDLLAASEAKNIAVYTHGGVICGLLSKLLFADYKHMLSFKVARGTVSKVEFHPNKRGVVTLLGLHPTWN